MKRYLFAALTLAAVVTLGVTAASQTQPVPRVDIDPDDIGGVVTGARGAEAGVWVIAETTDLPTRFRKIVVTDDQGRYVLPDLPKASYRVWVRGYGLVDSDKVDAAPGRLLNLIARPAPTPRAAAEYYPASYWYALLQVPPVSAFPLPAPAPAAGPAAGGRGGPPPPPPARNQAEYIAQLKSPCVVCHQMGTKATREMPPGLGVSDSSFAAWDRRLKAGQFGAFHASQMSGFGSYQSGVTMYADWTDRIAAGEFPPTPPPRPQGVERNAVISMWDASGPIAFIHDVRATDRRNPTVNANGPIYAGEFSYNSLVMVDPKKHTNEMIRIPTRPDSGPLRPFLGPAMEVPSPYWGDEAIWNETIQPNDVNLDQDGRVWMVSAIRTAEQQPAYCSDAARNRYAAAAPLKAANRHLSYYDPKTKRFTQVDTCFRTHHLQFAEDADNTLYISGNGTTIGWLNTRQLLQTGNEEQAQGWCTAYYDANGDGRIDPAADRRLDGTSYGIVVSPVDGSVWFASPGTPGRIFRMTRGTNPPATCLFEVYEPPFENAAAPGVAGFFPRGVDIDRNGVVWTALAGSNHIASFDRRRCKAVRAENAPSGQHCPEGWTLYPVAGPRFKGVTAEIGTDMFYYHWVDQHDTLGLGRNIPIATGTNSDALIALIPGTKQQITLRIPYPMGGFFARSMDGRIDDARAGWKGRGLWAPNASRPTWHQETGKGSTSFIAQFQMRPNPLAK